jgi:hypothetical protein
MAGGDARRPHAARPRSDDEKIDLVISHSFGVRSAFADSD